MIYAMTSIFRTDKGLAPGYTLAPPAEPGTYELAEPIGLLSGGDIHCATVVTIHKAAPLVILNTAMGWAAVTDEMNYGYSVVARSGGKARFAPGKDVIADQLIMDAALLAAVHTAAFPLDRTNRMINRHALHEIRMSPYTSDEYKLGRRVLLDFARMTERQYMLFMYTFIAVMHRIGHVTVKDAGGDKILQFRAEPVFWRDVVVTLAHIYKLRPFVRHFSRASAIISFSAQGFLEFTNAAFDAGVQAQFRDFRMLTKTATKLGVFVDERGYATLVEQHVDKKRSPSVEQLQHKLKPFTGRAVSFPELDGSIILEHNSMLVTKLCTRQS